MVALVSGELVPSDSEAWRAECEARGVVEMRGGRESRQAWLLQVERKRGQVAANKLRRDVVAMWER